jgi:hypothetical protein
MPAPKDQTRDVKPSITGPSSINLSLISSMGIAIVIHVVIALAVGSYVVFEGIVPLPFFQSDFVEAAPSSMIEEVPTLIEEEPLPAVASAVVETVIQEEGGSDAPDMSDLITVTSATSSPSFTMPTVAGNPGLISGRFTGGTGTGQGTGIGRGKVKLGSFFGSKNIGPGVLTGYLYDFKQGSDKKPLGYNKGNYAAISREFTDKWRPSILKDYYRTPEPLQLSQIIMPEMSASVAPDAFGVADEVQPSGWMAHYQGNITPPHSGAFRFCGHADDVLIVRVDEEVVFDGSLTEAYSNVAASVREGIGGSVKAGKWIELQKGTVYPIEIIVGEVPGGGFQAYLMVQEKDKKYETHSSGYPILPPFQMIPTEIPEEVIRRGIRILDEGLIFGAN